MNSYFDQQWDQKLADHPEALAFFSNLDAAQQEKMVNYIQSCDDSKEAGRRIAEMLGQLGVSPEDDT